MFEASRCLTFFHKSCTVLHLYMVEKSSWFVTTEKRLKSQSLHLSKEPSHNPGRCRPQWWHGPMAMLESSAGLMVTGFCQWPDDCHALIGAASSEVQLGAQVMLQGPGQEQANQHHPGRDWRPRNPKRLVEAPGEASQGHWSPFMHSGHCQQTSPQHAHERSRISC